MQRSTMQEAMSAPKVGGIVRLTGFVLKGVFLFELLGAVALMPIFIRDFGVRGIWLAFFHSISAFCNAGFDLLGTPDAQFSSLTAYETDPAVNVIIVMLILIGGIGFLTWEDMYMHKFHFKRYRMQSKVILTTTLILILLPAIFYFFVDFSDLPVKERILDSLFQSVTPRTAGFNTVDLALLTGAGQAVMIVLMLIGGSPGSTAGGMKTTTFAVLIGNCFASFKRKEDPQFFSRRVEDKTVKNAATIFVMYLSLFFIGAIVISVAEGLPMSTCLFETASAVGTVGLTLGITSQLGLLSQCVLMVLMFFGRVGGLTLIYAALSGTSANVSKVPQEKITVG